MAIIMSVILVIRVVAVVAAMFAADVMAVNPSLVVVGPMAGDPNHFPVARPIASAMAVIGPVPDFNAEALCRNRGRENDAGGRERSEQKFFRNHMCLIRRGAAKCVLCGITIVLSSWGQATAGRTLQAHKTEKPPRIARGGFSLVELSYPIPRDSSVGWSIAAVASRPWAL